MTRRFPFVVLAVLACVTFTTAGVSSAQSRPACRYLVVDGYDPLADAFRGEITIDRQSFRFDATDITRPRTFTLKNHAPGTHTIAAIFSFDTAWPRRSVEYAGDWTLGPSDFYRLRWPADAATNPARVAKLTIAASSEGEIRRLMGDSFKAIASCESAAAGISHTR